MINAAKKLIDKYKSITPSQIIEEWNKQQKEYPDEIIYGGMIMEQLTNFGTCGCILCKHANTVCKDCIHSFDPNWNDPEWFPCLNDSYNKINDSETPEELHKHIQERVKYLEKLISYAEQQANPSI